MENCANGSPAVGLSWQNITVSNDGKAIARGIAVGVGAPHQQIFALVPSLADDDTWLFNAADCVSAANSTCIGQKGGVYNSSLSQTFVQTTQAQWNGSQDDGFDKITPIFFNDNFFFGENGSLPGFPLFIDQSGVGTSSGLGLGPHSTFLDAAVKSGSAPSKAFGLWVGSRSENSPADGALWLGAYDEARVASDFTDFAMVPNCEFCVKIKNITYTTREGSTSLFSNSSEFLEVSLEPFQHSLQVPSDIFLNFLRASNGTVGTDSGTTGLVTVPTNAELGNLSVTFTNGYQTLIPASELFLPPRVFGPDGTYQILNNTYLVGGLSNYTAAPGYVVDWGIPIFTMNYMIVDYDSQTFSLARAEQGAYSGPNGALPQPLCKGIAAPSSASAGVPTAASSSSVITSSTSPPTRTPTSNPSHTNVGAIAGGVVGGVVGLLVIAILAFFLFRSRNREKALQQEHGSVGGSTAVANQSQKDHTSQGIPGSPTTELSEADHGNINQWLYTQDKYPSPTQEHPTSPTLGQPFEMPAHASRDYKG